MSKTFKKKLWQNVCIEIKQEDTLETVGDKHPKFYLKWVASGQDADGCFMCLFSQTLNDWWIMKCEISRKTAWPLTSSDISYLWPDIT